MNIFECISQLENLKAHCMDWGAELPWRKDVEALNKAISILKGTAPEVQEQSKFVLETSEGVCKNPNEHTTPVNMENQEARKILEEQFKLLSEESKRCEPKCLHNITNAMLNIYATLYPCQYDSKEC